MGSRYEHLARRAEERDRADPRGGEEAGEQRAHDALYIIVWEARRDERDQARRRAVMS